MTKDRERKISAIVVIRRSARILGVIIASFLLLMFIGQSLESYPQSEPIEPIGVIGLALIGIYVVAMFLALKWERVGSFLGMAALGGFFVILFLGLLPGNVSGGFSSKGVLNPLFLAFWLPILLYLLCRGLERRGRERAKAVL
ncbi:MAG: hypothetical protein KAR44_10795 [Candidatus Aegiribacteria sp.]|nr:hypothetical protein [Candidatus Aegiribacteria sp.]